MPKPLQNFIVLHSTVSTSPQVVAWTLVIVADSESVGVVRLVQISLGPLGLVAAAARLFLLPRYRVPANQSRIRLGPVSTGLLLFGIGFVVVLRAVPQSLVAELLGTSWAMATSVIIPLGLTRALNLSSIPAQALLASRRLEKQVSLARSANMTGSVLVISILGIMGRDLSEMLQAVLGVQFASFVYTAYLANRAGDRT